MYAKLVLSSITATSLLIRDIVRLCTSASPSTSLLTGFNAASSAIVDATPAGWSYVYSNVDTGSLAAQGTGASSGAQDWWAISAPCLDGVKTKYALLTCEYLGNTTSAYNGFCLTAATNVVTTTRTNEGFRTASASISYATSTNQHFLRFQGAGTYHVIATPRHITIIQDSARYGAVWETSVTDVHTFYNMTPMIQVNFDGTTASQTGNTTGAAVATPFTINASAVTVNVNAQIFGFTDPSTGTAYGNLVLVGRALDYGPTAAAALGAQPYLFAYSRTTTVSDTGGTRNTVNPIFFQGLSYGLPTTYVTGVCDIYATRGSAGTAGDTMTINGTTYTYFPCGASGAQRNNGLVMLTG